MQNFIISSSPHLHSKTTVTTIMADVLIALIPAVVASIYYFGIGSLYIILVAIASCMLSELIFEIITKRTKTLHDLSAVVTGVLLALNMPPEIPLWMVMVGSAFSIIVVKQIFGGIGKNFMNPALAGRCFMLIAWTGAMTTFSAPHAIDAVSSATPLGIMKSGSGDNLPSMLDVFLGNISGCIGETSAAALILGFLYLLIKKVVSAKIPLAYILSFAVLTFLFGNNTTSMAQWEFTIYQILTGGLLLGAFFMATDYTTTPSTPKGMIIFGIGCGVLTFLIRRFGGYPEGVSFSIILMNIASPIIEEHTIPKSFGMRGKQHE